MNEKPELADDGEQNHGTDETEQFETMLRETTMTRRMALQMGAATAGAAVVGTGSVAAQSSSSREAWNYRSDLVHDPYITGSVTVDLHEGGMDELEHIADDGTRESLRDHGVVLARRPQNDGGDPVAHNPVSFAASDLVGLSDDGDIIAYPEYAAFPRGIGYDHDTDSDTDERDVSVLEADHWTVDNSGSTGTLSVSDDGLGVRFAVPSQASGDVAVATFDLSTAGSEDATLSSGIARKVLQTVFDVDVLESATSVEIVLEDSAGATVSAVMDSSADITQTGVFADGTGSSIVGQARVGDLGSLDDIQLVHVRVSDGAADLLVHGFNVERESEWTFGIHEVTTTEDGETTLDTEDVSEPSGTISVTSLRTLEGTPFEGASIRSVVYDAELVASELPAENQFLEVRDAEKYDRDNIVESLLEFEWPSAYDLTVDAGAFMDEAMLPQTRYLSVDAATGVSDLEELADEEDVTWTSRTSDYSSVGAEVELLSTVSSSDRQAWHIEVLMDSDEVDAATGSASSLGGAAVGATSGSGDLFSMTAIIGLVTGIGLFLRKRIFALFGRGA